MGLEACFMVEAVVFLGIMIAGSVLHATSPGFEMKVWYSLVICPNNAVTPTNDYSFMNVNVGASCPSYIDHTNRTSQTFDITKEQANLGAELTYNPVVYRSNDQTYVALDIIPKDPTKKTLTGFSQTLKVLSRRRRRLEVVDGGAAENDDGEYMEDDPSQLLMDFEDTAAAAAIIREEDAWEVSTAPGTRRLLKSGGGGGGGGDGDRGGGGGGGASAGSSSRSSASTKYRYPSGRSVTPYGYAGRSAVTTGTVVFVYRRGPNDSRNSQSCLSHEGCEKTVSEDLNRDDMNKLQFTTADVGDDFSMVVSGNVTGANDMPQVYVTLGTTDFPEKFTLGVIGVTFGVIYLVTSCCSYFIWVD
eukprot:GFYU01000488.1.p1 GENE.GFYU01000488.1~~GFYU01000488.1.p1  ORF type:complete len:359 (-),score=101.46 GFYU01000488.1:195-1271(-)